MSDIGTAALGIGTGIITNTINQAMGLNQAENLQNLSIAGQKELADYNYNKQLELFEATPLGISLLSHHRKSWGAFKPTSNHSLSLSQASGLDFSIY